MRSLGYGAGVEAALRWAFVALNVVFSASWAVTGLAEPDRLGPPLWAAIAAYVVLTVVIGHRGARSRIGAGDTVALLLVAVAMQVAWVLGPTAAVTPGQRCMITTAVVFGAFVFTTRGARTGLVGIASAAQLAVDLAVTDPISALSGLWPVVTAVIAIGVCVPVLRAAARRADLAAEERQAAATDAAALAAQRAARRDLQAILHDAVVAALRAIGLPEVSRAEAQHAARDAVAAIERSPTLEDDQGPQDLAPLVRDLVAVPGTVTSVSAMGPAVVPGDVARAASAALSEVLRNVGRHARARNVDVVLDGDGDGFVLTATDDGVGFRTGAIAHSHGLRYSVLGRMGDVGGQAEVRSSPGRGTEVRLTWRSAPAASRVAPTRSERIAAALGDVRRPLTAVVAPYLVMTGAFAIRYLPDGGLPAWVPLWFAGLAVITLVVLGRAHIGVNGYVVLGALGYGVAGTAATLLVLPATALEDYSSWPLGATTSLLAVVAVVRPAREAAAALVVQQAAIAAAALTGRFGEGAWTSQLAALAPAALSTVTPVVLGLIISQAIMRLGDVVTRANAERGAIAAAASARRAMEALHDRRMAVLGEEILPFLRAVADGTTDPGSPDVRRRARALEQAARDELHLPGVLDPLARDLLRRARAEDCVITFHAGSPDVPAPGLVRDLLVTAMTSGSPPRQIVISLQPTDEGVTVGLVTLPGDEDRANALRRTFGTAVLDSTSEATWAEVSSISRSGASTPADPRREVGAAMRHPHAGLPTSAECKP